MSGTSDGPARVLWLTKGLGRGGAEQLLVGLSRHLDPQRTAVHVAYVLPHKDALVSTLAAQGVTVSCLGAGAGGPRLWPLRLRRLLREHSFDIVHTHAPVPAALARLLVDSDQLVLHTEHNMWERYRVPTRWANRLTYGRNNAVLAVSNGVARSIERVRGTHASPTVEVLTHGIDVDAVRRGDEARLTARSQLGLPTDTFVVGTVANLTPKKDQDTLLRAVAQLHREVQGVRLVIVGGGPLERHLHELAHELGIGAIVHFAGVRADVAEIVCGFDVFALPSRHEGLALALLEAMAAEVPCVVTAVGGMPEVIGDEETGLLVPVGDAAALARSLLRVHRDTGLADRLTKAASVRVRNYGIEPATGRLQEHYDRALRHAERRVHA